MQGPDYYLKNSAHLGWGDNQAKIDLERSTLIKQHLSGHKILDIGCGTGIYVDYIAALGYDAFGVDFVKEFIKLAQKRHRGTFTVARAEKLPFKSYEFDSVLLFDILEHGDDKKILEEAKRVSNKRILIIVPRAVDTALEQTGVVFRHYIDKSHLREYTEQDLKKLARQSGMKVKGIYPVHPVNLKAVYHALFTGPTKLRNLSQKILFKLMRPALYYTEYFVVLEKD